MHKLYKLVTLKSDSTFQKKLFKFYLLHWKPLKNEENFISEALFVLKILKFCLEFLVIM